MKTNVKLSKKTPKTGLRLKSKVVTQEEDTKKSRTTKKSSLPPDEYKQEFEPLELEISETTKIVFSVSRKGDLGLPHFDIRVYTDTEKYTGPTKLGVNIPVEYLLEFSEIIEKISDLCEKKGLFEEFEE